ncbi:hypothetical protein [Catenuloplanes japonicus]|uniref:hypothetical protein n=1 Tax=Catenuloplanes japonicus TaxID=33876 RepID=UPI000525641D|nr:hypothetical protein [Catenuloplanes japonicus]
MIGKVVAWLGLISGTLATFWGLLELVGTRDYAVGGVALGVGLVLAVAGFALLIRSAREATEDAGPDTGKRKLLAVQRGWRYTVDDPEVEDRFPNVGLSRNAAGNEFSRVLSGEIDGQAFDVFNHAYTFGAGSVAVRREETVFLLRLRPCSAAFSVTDTDRVMPPEVQSLVMTEALRRASAKARVRDWAVVESTLVYAEAVIPDARIARIPRRLADLSAVAAAIPSIVFSGTRID